MRLMRNALLKFAPAAALVLGMAAFASPAMAASPQAQMPSTIAVNSSFKVTVSNIPSGTKYVSVVLPGIDQQHQGYTIAFVSVPSGQTSITVSGTIPSTLTFGPYSSTTVGGPRAIMTGFLSSSFASVDTISNTVNITGVPTDHAQDDGTPYKLSYNPSTHKATITNVPANSFINVFFRSLGQPESEASNTILGGSGLTAAGTVTVSVYGIPSQSGYLEAEIYSSSETLDTNELPLSSGLPVGQAPEVPWAAMIPAIGVAVGIVVFAKKRRHA